MFQHRIESPYKVPIRTKEQQQQQQIGVCRNDVSNQMIMYKTILNILLYTNIVYAAEKCRRNPQHYPGCYRIFPQHDYFHSDIFLWLFEHSPDSLFSFVLIYVAWIHAHRIL